MRTFLVGAYWGGLVAATAGLLAIVVLQSSVLLAEYVQHLQQMIPVLVLAGFALLTSVLAAGITLVLRELVAVRAAVDRAVALPAQLPARLSNWTGMAGSGGGKATTSCAACGRTNWREALVCVDCGTPMMCGPAAAH